MENSTLTTNCSESYSLENPMERNLFLFFFLAIVIIAFPTNVFSLYVSWQHIRQKNELGVYLLNLALTDLALAIGLSLWSDFLWRGTWVHERYVCELYVFFVHTNFYISNAFLCCIAVDRYLAVVHPFKFTFFRKVGTAAAISVAVWVLVVCLNASTILWEDTYREYNNVSVCFDISHPVSENVVYSHVAHFVFGFIVPVLLVVFSTWGICKAVKSNQATEEQERKRILKLLAVVLLCLLLCIGPIHITILVHIVADNCTRAAWLTYLYEISKVFASLNCLTDPLLYCFITKTGKANVNQVVLFFRVKKRSKNEGVV